MRAHRRKFPLKEWQALPASDQRSHARLARLLRLAVLINHSRPEQPPEAPRLVADGEALHLTLAGEEDPALLLNDLEQEVDYQAAAGFTLTLSRG